jgi:hypothetical protein
MNGSCGLAWISALKDGVHAVMDDRIVIVLIITSLSQVQYVQSPW